MRHKYGTHGIVLSRSLAGEANVLITILTPDVGLIRARAQGVRRPGAKLAASITTFSESDFMLVRGREYWRVAGAVLKENWFLKMNGSAPRGRAARVCRLFLRLIADETNDPRFFTLIRDFFETLSIIKSDKYEAAEILAVLHILFILGLDSGGVIDGYEFTDGTLSEIIRNRRMYVARINRGINASGL